MVICGVWERYNMHLSSLITQPTVMSQQRSSTASVVTDVFSLDAFCRKK